MEVDVQAKRRADERLDEYQQELSRQRRQHQAELERHPFENYDYNVL